MANVKITSYKNEVESLVRSGIVRGLKVVGGQAAEYAADKTPVDTSNLQQSMTFVVDEGDNTVYVGTNIEYGVYVELGTGIYASEGKGRTTPWFVRPDGAGKYKTPFWTRGIKPHHMLKKSITEHLREYINILAASIAAKLR